MTRAAVLATVATAVVERIEIPAPEPTAMACGNCDEVVALADLRWRNRRALLLGCRFCTPTEDPVPVTADYPGLYTDVASSANALLQSHSWITRDPDTRELHLVDLDAMTPSHRAHLLDWLRRNASVMRGHVHRSINQSQRWGAITWAERAELIRDLEAYPPEVWIEDTPLVRRLVQMEPARGPRRNRARWLPARLRRTR